MRAFLKPLLILFLCLVPLLAQSNSGELRLKVTDPDGLGVKSSVELSSEATQFHRNYSTDPSGGLTTRNMPFSLYHIQVEHEGFSTFSGLIEVRSSLPIEYIVKLSMAAMSTAIQVTAESEMLDPDRAGTINRIDSQAIADRTSSHPGRSLPALVSSQPGWVYEGSAVLHPRGSEYQTQFVMDGVPLTDNRSPASGPEIEADDAGSLTVYTAGIPAEYGRKMGGVVEVDTNTRGPAPRCQHRKPEQPPQRVRLRRPVLGQRHRPTEELFRTLPDHVLEHQISVEWNADRVSIRKYGLEN